MENVDRKAWHYFQSDTLPSCYGRMIQLGKTFDTRKNVEETFSGKLLGISEVIEGLDGGCLFTIVDKRRK